METSPFTAPVRPDPARAERHRYPLWQEVSTRFGDLDPLGHVNNVAITQLCEESRVWFGRMLMERAGGGLHRLVLASMSVQYLAETQYPEPVEIGIGVTRVGSSSYSLAQALYQHGRCVGLADATLVHALPTGVLPLPEGFRAELERYQVS